MVALRVSQLNAPRHRALPAILGVQGEAVLQDQFGLFLPMHLIVPMQPTAFGPFEALVRHLPQQVTAADNMRDQSAPLLTQLLGVVPGLDEVLPGDPHSLLLFVRCLAVPLAKIHLQFLEGAVLSQQLRELGS